MNVVIVRAFALRCANDAIEARDELDVAIDKLVASREAVEASLVRCRDACELAERMAVFAARAMAGDVEPATLAEAIEAIEEMIGMRRQEQAA